MGYDSDDDALDEMMRAEIEAELDESLSPELRAEIATSRIKYLELRVDLKASEMFTQGPRRKLEIEKASRQRVAIELYDEACARIAKYSNVAAWLRKRRRTPEVVLKHGSHSTGLSISFRLPDEGEDVELAWDVRPHGADGKVSVLADTGTTFVSSSKALHTYHGPAGGSIGGSVFESHVNSTETHYEVYRRERDAGKSPDEAASYAAAFTLKPPHRYAPEVARITCWCGRTLHVRWYLLMRNIERSLRPGHTRVEDKHIVTTLPVD